MPTGPGLGDSVVAKRRPVSPVARVGVCQEDSRPPTSALHSVYDRRVLLTSPLPLSKVAVSSAAVKKGATSETLGTRISRGLSQQCTARLQPLIQRGFPEAENSHKGHPRQFRLDDSLHAAEWTVAGISNALDGMEDDPLWDSEDTAGSDWSLSSQPDEWDESPQPQGVRTALMAHQRQALQWMLWREEQEAPGGILADAMGLGKTLTMLSLVEQQRSRDKAHKLAAKIKSNDKTDGKNDSETAAPAPPRGGTLVVCPLSLLHQWEEEVQRHLPGQWQVHVHHGRNRTVDPEELARCDLVVTTYDTISSDWARVDATGKSGQNCFSGSATVVQFCTQENADSNLVMIDVAELSPLFTVKWRRLVLDEAHNIRNLHTRRAKAACALLAWSRWALTGTPVHNDLNDMRSLLKFLQCHPFDDDSFWKQWVKENPGVQQLRQFYTIYDCCTELRQNREIC
ncbi:hypothetical protein HPB51_003368 [Rhipicephalus microplus]|uniref:Helicase ATP-binding domain-containing protein n=1 Tax=Rhipicephalus microplus TaxID=6941 RepID=A0A9J6D3T3_RHIMP|nr:hypothetical protein HPB51_003368 [Rhipicephalus microplus]